MKLDRMKKEELEAYYRHLDNIVILRDNIYTGRAEGREEERYSIARNLKQLGASEEVIIKATGLSSEEINKL